MKDYSDIIDMPYRTTGRHKHMSLHDRAAQFAPFAALTGFEAIIDEQARFTESRPVLCDDDAAVLNEQFQKLIDRIDEQSLVTLTYFEKDKYKEGGCLKDKTGIVRLIDTVNREFIFFDKERVAIDDVVAIRLSDK